MYRNFYYGPDSCSYLWTFPEVLLVRQNSIKKSGSTKYARYISVKENKDLQNSFYGNLIK